MTLSILIGVLLLIIFCIAMLLYLIRYHKQIRVAWGVAAAIFITTALGFCILGANHGPIFVRTSGDPAITTETFFDAVKAKDGATALEQLDNFSELDLTLPEGDSSSVKLQAALQDSYSYEMRGESSRETFASCQMVDFTYLNLQSMADSMKSDFKSALYDIMTDRTASGDLDSVYAEAYSRALDNALSHVTDFYETTTLELEVDYSLSGWHIQPEDEMLTLIAGGCSVSASSGSLKLSEIVSSFTQSTIDSLAGRASSDRTIYTIPYNATVAPAPNPSKYGSVDVSQADQVMNIISYAQLCGLLQDQSTIFSTDINFQEGTQIGYYCDDSILVICWKEFIESYAVTCCEIKIADGSQFKRKLVNDTYGSGTQAYASALAASCNAVVAMNADFYGFRSIGITVYQGQLYRYQTSCDALFIDGNGRFIFYYPDGSLSFDEMQQYITDNNIQFSLAFGPVLIENYEIRTQTGSYAYGLGEPNDQYSRAAICEYDDLHYFYMHVGTTDAFNTPRITRDEFARILATKNLRNAYNLDGGQTGELVFQNVPFSHMDYGSERLVSDIIYFATAIPEGEND